MDDLDESPELRHDAEADRTRMEAMPEKREMLRHFLATLAYRGNNILRDMPESIASFRPSEAVRTPLEILNHVNGVLTYAHSHLIHYESTRLPISDWSTEVNRFFTILNSLDGSFRDGTRLNGTTEERVLQGPLADAMLHLGQIGIFRRMAGSPVTEENYIKADIELGDIK